MISIANLGKAYNKKIVLNIADLAIDNGEIFGLVGNNGAGKTTLLRLMLDLIHADKGQVQSEDYIVSKSESWKEYTSSYLDEGFLIDYLTPEEFFHFVGQGDGLTKKEIDEKLTLYNGFFNGEVLGHRK